MRWLMSQLGARPGSSRPARQRLSALLVVFALCWPAAAAALVALNSAPAVPACCMRGAHHCHQPEDQSQDSGGAKFQAVCRACGVCHALTNTVAHLAPAAATRLGGAIESLNPAEPTSQPAHRPSRQHGSRAPPSCILA